MKKLNYLVLCLLTTTVLLSIISSCSKTENHKEEPIPAANLAPFTFPEKATIETLGNHINYTLPDGYTGYGVDQQGNFISFNNGSITCTCKSGDGGCSPTTVGSSGGCLMTTCESCDLKRATRISGVDVVLEEAIILAMGTPVKKVTSVEDLKGKIMLPPQFVKLDIIQDEIEKIEKEAARHNGERTKIAPVLLYGYVVMLEVPEAYGLSTVASAYYVCNCTEGTTGWCRKQNYGTYIICESTCKGCTMRATLKEEDRDKEYAMEVVNHRISFL